MVRAISTVPIAQVKVVFNNLANQLNEHKSNVERDDIKRFLPQPQAQCGSHHRVMELNMYIYYLRLVAAECYKLVLSSSNSRVMLQYST